MRAGWNLDDVGYAHDFLDQQDVIAARHAAADRARGHGV
jgi:hypothetical protein